MNDEKVYTPEVIVENPFPGGEVVPSSSNPNLPADTYTAKTESEKKFPIRKIATELISTALNTKSKKILQAFEFTPSGSIQIGEFEDGISGDIRITPDGITARDLAGLITFALDGTNGDAVFRGTLQAGTLIGGNGTVLIQESLDGNGRIILYNDGLPAILIGDPDE